MTLYDKRKKSQNPIISTKNMVHFFLFNANLCLISDVKSGKFSLIFTSPKLIVSGELLAMAKQFARDGRVCLLRCDG